MILNYTDFTDDKEKMKYIFYSGADFIGTQNIEIINISGNI